MTGSVTSGSAPASCGSGVIEQRQRQLLGQAAHLPQRLAAVVAERAEGVRRGEALERGAADAAPPPQVANIAEDIAVLTPVPSSPGGGGHSASREFLRHRGIHRSDYWIARSSRAMTLADSGGANKCGLKSAGMPSRIETMALTSSSRKPVDLAHAEAQRQTASAIILPPRGEVGARQRAGWGAFFDTRVFTPPGSAFSRSTLPIKGRDEVYWQATESTFR